MTARLPMNGEATLPALHSLAIDAEVASTYRGKRVLVTGGFGFVGGHVVRTLLDLEAEVTVLDNRTAEDVPSLINQQRLRERIHIAHGDLADPVFVRRVVHEGGFSHIFNFAAYATVIEKAVESPFDTIMANTMGWVHIMDAARTAPVPPEAVFLSSTDKVYGEMDGEAYQEGKTPLRGIGVYDAAKLAADVLAKTYFEVFRVPTVVLRMCNIYGPADFNTGYRLIPKAMRSLFGQKEPLPPELYYDALEHKRDYLYIDDAVRAILSLCHHPHCRGEVFNLKASHYSGTPDVLRSVVHLAAEQEHVDNPHRAEQILTNGIAVRVRASQAAVVTIKHQHLDGSKLQAATGFTPLVEFDEGLRRTIQAYRQHLTLDWVAAE